MKTKITLFALFIFLSNDLFASHAVDADLTYRCIGGQAYEVTLTFYRDCAGIPAPNNPTVSIKSASCNETLALTLGQVGQGVNVTPACSTTVTACNGGSFTGFQQYIYRGVVTLPQQCTDWIFSYSLCCRNAPVTMISSPGTSVLYVYASLDNTISAGNNSPVLTNLPITIVCQGQLFCSNQGAVDSDGDSLAYELIAPLQSPGDSVIYLPGYSPRQPLISVPPMTLDSTNGDICMTPQQIEVAVMALLVKEYRNGIFIGSVERDMQVTVMNCENNLPSLTGINGTDLFDTTVSAGIPLCFDVLSNDIDTGQTLTVTWNGAIPGATFTATGTDHPTGQFCWTPTIADMRSNPWYFTVMVADNACPYYGYRTYTFKLTASLANNVPRYFSTGSLYIYPNPAEGKFRICSPFNNYLISITNLLGQEVCSMVVKEREHSMDLSDCPAGMYFITASDGKNKFLQKVMLK